MIIPHEMLMKPGQGNSLSVVGDIFTFKTDESSRISGHC
jgi:hypothetical protein